MSSQDEMNTKAGLSTLSTKISNVTAKIETLSSRDKLALIFLALFLFGFFGVYGGYQVHQKTNKQHLVFDKKVGDYFWMRAQASNLSDAPLNTDSDDNGQLSSKISQTAAKFGIADLEVMATADGVQFGFQHRSQSVISRVLSDMQQQNLTFSRLQISQSDDGQTFRVEATVSQS